MEQLDKPDTPANDRHFISDAAISKPEDDRLGWGRLVDNIVSSIMHHIPDPGFVVGINGKWGSGKSTLLNLVERRLKTDYNQEVFIFRYSPWLHPKVDHSEHFFLGLAGLLGHDASKPENKALSKTLEIYALAGSSATALFTFASSIYPPLLSVAGISALFTGFGSRFKRYRKEMAALRKVPMAELKTQLNSYLASFNRRIVIIIDDIDRLPPEDICGIFQLIKNNGALNNITYLIAYDEDMVRSVLIAKYGSLYCDFTSKIVQTTITVPSPEPTILEQYFIQQLECILSTCPAAINEYWSAQRWTEYHYSYIRHWYTSFREAKRLLNGIMANLPLVFNRGMIEVNPVDYVAVELIRIRFPGVYLFIRNNKNIFAYARTPSRILGTAKRQRTAYLEEYWGCINNVDVSLRKNVDELLKDLFPRISALENDVAYIDIDLPPDVEGMLRIEAPRIFDRYFLYANYSGDIPNREIMTLISSIQNVDYVRNFLDANKSRISLILRRLMPHCEKAIKEYPYLRGPLLTFFMKAADLVTLDSETPIDESLSELTIYYSLIIFAGIPNDFRNNVFRQSIRDSRALYAPMCIINSVLDSTESAGGLKAPISPEAAAECRLFVSDYALEWLSNPQSLDHGNFRAIARTLKGWIDPQKYEFNLHLLLREEKDFKRFIAQFLVPEITIKYGQVSRQTSYEYDFSELESIISIQEIAKRVLITVYQDNEPFEIKTAFEIFAKDYNSYLSTKGE